MTMYFCICRCKKNNPCEQFCKDTGSEVTCSCKAGFILGEDAHSCSRISTRNDPPIDNDIKHDTPKCPAGYELDVNQRTCQGTNLKAK